MHWLLHLLVDAVLVFGLVASYCAYQEHRRKQSEYARVQLYEDADKPCVPAPLLAPAPARGSSSPPCSTRCQALGSSAWTAARASNRVHPLPAARVPQFAAALLRREAGPTRTTETTSS